MQVLVVEGEHHLEGEGVGEHQLEGEGVGEHHQEGEGVGEDHLEGVGEVVVGLPWHPVGVGVEVVVVLDYPQGEVEVEEALQ